MSFENNIKQWVHYDNEIKKLNNELKNLRNKKNTITTDIFNHVNENSLNSSIIKISDGNLRFVNSKTANPLTFTFVEECLNQIISDQEKVKQIINFIKQKRQYKYVDDIKRLYK